ncbi:MAG: PAS domain S-box protein, partial [Anaerolineae bacterium]|nr:PAS domain S-box protein [Anaerolineae bacterium]
MTRPKAKGGQAILAEAARIVDEAAADIAASWVRRRQAGLYPERRDARPEGPRDSDLPMVRGIAEALRDQSSSRQEAWAEPVRAHARARLAQGLPLTSLADELHMLRQEVWRVLGERLHGVAAEAVFDLAAALDRAFTVLLAIALGASSHEVQGAPPIRWGTAPGYLETILRQMPCGVIVAEAPSGRLILCNERAQRIWRRSLPLLASTAEYASWEGYHADGRRYRPEEWPLSRSLLEGDMIVDEGICIRRGDGTLGWISAHSAPVRDTAGRIGAAVMAFDDVSERGPAEAALHESEARFRAIFDAGPLGMAVIGLDYRLTTANDALARMLGYPRHELIGRTLADVTHPDDLQADVALRERLLRGEITHSVLEKRYYRKDGGILWGRLTSSLIRGPGGKPLYYLSLLEDVTERKRVDEERERLLREVQSQRELLEQLVETAPVAIAVVRGPEHRYELANPAYRRIVDASIEGVVGRTVAEVIPNLPEAAALLDEVHRTGVPVRRRGVQARVGHERRESYWDIDLIPLPGPGDGVARVLILADEVTGLVIARKRAEELVAEVAAERARLRAVIDNAPEAIVVSDERARVLLTNPVAERLYARPVPYGEEYEAHAALRLERPDGTPYDPRDLPLTRSALDGETITGVEMAIVWPDGERRDLLVNSAPIRDERGRITGAVGV